MKKIILLSDTHSYIDESILSYLSPCDEVWHGGDFGTIEIADKIKSAMKPGAVLRGVYGNIDGYDVRSIYPEKNHFNCDEVKVFMQHIGGYPGRYAPGVKEEIKKNHSQLFISGHSHILKIIYDDKLECLHINPGAAGKQGWHKVRTMVRFEIDKKDIKNCEVIELGAR